jgi:spore germination cell wall hydrolase CwlJ-like protein
MTDETHNNKTIVIMMATQVVVSVIMVVLLVANLVAINRLPNRIVDILPESTVVTYIEDPTEPIEALETTIEKVTESTEPTETMKPTESTEVTESTESTEPTEVIEVTEPIIKEITDSEVTVPNVIEYVHEVTEVPVVEEPEVVISQSDKEMLACVIYQEAGGDYACDECRRRVADIVLNRVEDDRFPDTIYGVLTQENQYGRMHWTGVVWPSRASNSGEANAVARAYRIAEEVLSGQHSSLYGNGYIWQAGFAQGSDGFWCCGHLYGR